MYTYTTPAITCNLAGVEFTHVDFVRVAVKGERTQIVRQVPVAQIDTVNGIVAVTLTQEETASLGVGQCHIQARIHYTDGSVEATNKVIRDMKDVLDKVVI